MTSTNMDQSKITGSSVPTPVNSALTTRKTQTSESSEDIGQHPSASKETFTTKSSPTEIQSSSLQPTTPTGTRQSMESAAPLTTLSLTSYSKESSTPLSTNVQTTNSRSSFITTTNISNTSFLSPIATSTEPNESRTSDVFQTTISSERTSHSSSSKGTTNSSDTSTNFPNSTFLTINHQGFISSNAISSSTSPSTRLDPSSMSYPSLAANDKLTSVTSAGFTSTVTTNELKTTSPLASSQQPNPNTPTTLLSIVSSKPTLASTIEITSSKKSSLSIPSTASTSTSTNVLSTNTATISQSTSAVVPLSNGTTLSTTPQCTDCLCNGGTCFFSATLGKCQCQCPDFVFGDTCSFVPNDLPAHIDTEAIPTLKANLTLEIFINYQDAFKNLSSPESLAFTKKLLPELEKLCKKAEPQAYKTIQITKLSNGSIVAESVAQYNYQNNETQIQFLNSQLDVVLSEILNDTNNLVAISQVFGNSSVLLKDATLQAPPVTKLEDLKPFLNCSQFPGYSAEMVSGQWQCVGPCKLNPDHCHQHGECLNDITGKPVCKCSSNRFEQYYGPQCEFYSRRPAFYGALFGSLAAAVLLLIIIILIAFIVKRRRLGRRSSSYFEEDFLNFSGRSGA